MKHPGKLLALCVFFLVSHTGYAQIYQCKDAQGHVNFTDKPCDIASSAAPIKQVEAAPAGSRAAAAADLPTEQAAAAYLPRSIKLKFRSLLETGQYRDLNVQLASAHAAAVAKPEDEQELFTAYAAFDTRTDTIAKQLDRWVASTPDAYQPYLARAYHSYGLGWAARGGKWSTETSTAQFDAMNGHFADARRDIAAATERGAPALIPSYLQMGMWRTSGAGDSNAPLMMKRAQQKDNDEMLDYLTTALEVSPASYRIRDQFMQALYPRWGGNYLAMAEFSKIAQEFVKHNPRIAFLEGAVYADIAYNAMNDDAYLKADSNYAKALEFGDNPVTLMYRGINSYHQEKYEEALRYLDQSVATDAEIGKTYYQRGLVYHRLDRLDEALADYQRKVLLDALDEDAQKLRKYLALDFYQAGFQRVKSRDYHGAVELYGKSVSLDGQNADVIYRRGWALKKLGKYDAALADARQAIAVDPGHYNSYVLLDSILARSQDWSQIIRYWNAYIALQPDNPDAYYERAGTYLHYGDRAASLRDLKKAADLGHVQARERYEAIFR